MFIAFRVLSTVFRSLQKEPKYDPGRVQTVCSTAEWEKWMQEKGLLIADFTATWCGPCKNIAPVYAQMSTMVRHHSHNSQAYQPLYAPMVAAGVILLVAHVQSEYSTVTFLKVDVDKVREVAARCGVRAMPTFQLYKDGKRVDQVQGANAEAVRKMIAKHS